MNVKSLSSLALVLALLFCCCKKDNDIMTPQQHDENTATPAGTPNGEAVTKTIDEAGGELTSADGRLKIIIPAGAVTQAKTFSIQPITNELPDGIGNAYRITPHGEQFSKPVTLVFNYKPEDTLNTIANFMDIAYQDEQGTWQAVLNSTLDRAKHRLSVTTTHFSDWGYFKSLKLEPQTSTVEQEAVITLKLTTRFPRLDPDDSPSGDNTAPVYTSPRPLRIDEVKGWSYSGEGSLDADVSSAVYVAPDHVPAANPEAVSVSIDMHRKGQFLLLASITVLGNNGVKWLQVDEDFKKESNNGKCALYIYGSFGSDPGAGKRSVTIEGTPAEIDLWSPGILRCFIDKTISGAIEIKTNDKVIATSVLRKFESNFLYTRYHGGLLNSGNPDALKETAKFHLVYRGFGDACPADVDPLFEFDGGLAVGSEVDYTLSGKASITAFAGADHCEVTTIVALPGATGWKPLSTPSAIGLYLFITHVQAVKDGIIVQIDFSADDVQENVRVKRTDCNGSYLDPPKTLGVSFEGFNMKPIELKFYGTHELALKNGDKINSTPLSSGILTEAWDNTAGDPTQYESDGFVPASFENTY